MKEEAKQKKRDEWRDLTHWEMDEGLVGATFEGVPGFIQAWDEETLFVTLDGIRTSLEEVDKAAHAAGSRVRRVDVDPTFRRITDIVWMLSFAEYPGFLVTFANEQELQTWLGHLVQKVVAKRRRPTSAIKEQ